MDNAIKALVIMAVVIYIISPLDIAPGMLDDAVVLLMGIAANQKISSKNIYKEEISNEEETIVYNNSSIGACALGLR